MIRTKTKQTDNRKPSLHPGYGGRVLDETSGVPLAARMRPKSLDQFVGQERVLGEGTALRRAIEAGQAGSLILWGPPGVGKTTLAHIIAKKADATLERVSAVTAGVKDLKDVIERAKKNRGDTSEDFLLSGAQPSLKLRRAGKIDRRVVLIVDEIHRFNKSPSDCKVGVSGTFVSRGAGSAGTISTARNITGSK